MWNDVNKMLKRAADCQKLSAPEDALSAIVQEFSEETELDEKALDQVAAAAQLQHNTINQEKRKR